MPVDIRKISERAQARVVETRAVAQQDLDVDDAGTFTGYIALWDQVDSYNTRFKRGAFKKTFRERKGKIKVLDCHGELIGKVIDAVEDDTGAWVSGKLTLDVQRAAEVRALIKDKAYTALSFGFSTVQDKRDPKTGVRDITEVMLYEVSPVIFPANENAEIMSIRSTDFNSTLDEKRLKRDGDMIVDSLMITLMDLHYSHADIPAYDLALEAFHAEYLDWVVRMRASEDNGMRSMTRNPVVLAMSEILKTESTDDIAARTSCTADEVRTLKYGGLLPIESRSKLAEISPEVSTAHAQLRSETLTQLCAELRTGGISPAEGTRLKSLLGIDHAQPAVSDTQSAVNLGDIAQLIESLRTVKLGV